MFSKILIANRGEIACRVAATAKSLGINTVAVYSDADANAKHVQACDEAVYIGAASPKDSYLRADAVLAAALKTGAQAIHPGYGFLSENAEFAKAVADAGLVFIGPPAHSIAAMGSKSAAKALMEKAGVPLTPGYHGDNQDAGFLQAQATQIGYPVIIKAVAGGGGKGMRIVNAADEFAAALASCQREAQNAFGNAVVLVEKYIQRPRHIEVQVFADSHGNAVYLFERDCSVQRRHQKVLEEAPAPHLHPQLRQAMGEAAVAAAKSVGYIGAGTVEFIADADMRTPAGKFYFMEMNTRLQVEHPVTEMITGFDLVDWQLRVAAGEALPKQQHELTFSGHSFEARLYAEQPENQFLPSIGQLTHLQFPAHTAFNRVAAVRVDSGVRTGDSITPHYDPMIAKLITHGASRTEALAKMCAALAQTQVVGLHSNVAFLQRLCGNAAFASGQVHTGLIAQETAYLFPAAAPAPLAAVLLMAGSFAQQLQQGTAHSHNPWLRADGWRGTTWARTWSTQTLRFSDSHGHAYEAQLGFSSCGLTLDYLGQTYPLSCTGAAAQLTIQTSAMTVTGSVIASDTQPLQRTVFVDSQRFEFAWFDPSSTWAQGDDDSHGGLRAPMPGKIVAHLAKLGEPVSKGAAVLVMEAMKMEHTLTAPADGVVSAYYFAVGEQVSEGASLLEFVAAESVNATAKA